MMQFYSPRALQRSRDALAEAAAAAAAAQQEKDVRRQARAAAKALREAGKKNKTAGVAKEARGRRLTGAKKGYSRQKAYKKAPKAARSNNKD